MTDSTVVAEFPFVTNKSFAGDRHPITIPARYNQQLKDCGLTDSVSAKISFRAEPNIEGSIRVGWRSGGRYYQITMPRTANDIVMVNIGTRLMVRVLKTPKEWLIEIA